MNNIQNIGAVVLGGLVVVGAICFGCKINEHFAKRTENKLGMTLGTIDVLSESSHSMTGRAIELSKESEKLTSVVAANWKKLSDEEKNGLTEYFKNENKTENLNKKQRNLINSIKELQNREKEMTILSALSCDQRVILMQNGVSIPDEKCLKSWAPYLGEYSEKLNMILNAPDYITGCLKKFEENTNKAYENGREDLLKILRPDSASNAPIKILRPNSANNAPIHHKPIIVETIKPNSVV